MYGLIFINFYIHKQETIFTLIQHIIDTFRTVTLENSRYFFLKRIKRFSNELIT